MENLTEIKIKTSQKLTRTLTIFVEHGIMAHNPAQPTKTLELYYPMIQFSVMIISLLIRMLCYKDRLFS